jgi:mannose-6-phosphate isomerase-like protein (cupin superfamily)
MKLLSMSLIVASLTLPVAGAAPPGYKYWSASELKAAEKKLATKITDTNKIALDDRIIDHGSYFAAMVHREGNAPAEMHESWADLYVISTGSGILEVGGTIPDGKETAPGEIRGSSIQGATRQRLSPGDVVHIPARTPHNVVIEPGGQITYFIFKVKPQS